MFVYENGNSLNLTFKGNMPVENPEVVIKGYEDGATLTVNGTTYGSGSKEFEERAKTLVYQKDNKLMITFQGISGINNPDVIVDEIDREVYNINVGTESVTLSVVDGVIVPVTDTTETPEEEEVEPEQPEEEIPEVDGPTYDLPEFSEEEEE